jgi:DNA modification methylase
MMRHPAIEMLPPADLRPYPRNARTHAKKQIRQIARSIERFGFTNPVLVDETNQIIAGHGRVAAALQLGLEQVPVLRLSHLSEADKRAYILADNRLAERSGWNREVLALELGELSELLPGEIDITGFEVGEVDLLLTDFDDAPDPADEAPAPATGAPVTRTADLWLLGPHRLTCGDARDGAAFERLMAGERAEMVFTDPPYNVPISGHVLGHGTHHREFAFASGEMSSAEFTAFLAATLGHAAAHSADGSIHYVCMDWRHIAELIAAGRSVYTELKNICVWAKTNAGQGSFYRSQHELVAVFKNGTAPHLNTFELGQHGRSRTNVWTYAGVNTFRAGRMDDLSLHPTVKPVALVADAMRDCSRRKGLVLDPFMGSGTTLMAGEKVGRRVAGIECDPAYVDGAVRRWQAFTGRDAVLEATGETFEEVQARRSAEAAGPGERRDPDHGRPDARPLGGPVGSDGADADPPVAVSGSPDDPESNPWVRLCRP